MDARGVCVAWVSVEVVVLLCGFPEPLYLVVLEGKIGSELPKVDFSNCPFGRNEVGPNILDQLTVLV